MTNTRVISRDGMEIAVETEFEVSIFETFSTNPDNCRLTVIIKTWAVNVSAAIRQAINMAHEWNRDNPAIRANVIVCNGHIAHI